MSKRNLPIRCVSIAAHVLRFKGKRAQVLLLKRRGSRLDGTWQMVAGKLEKGETAAQAAWREVQEETGLTPQTFYAGDTLECYFNHTLDLIELSPVFVAVVDAHAKVRLSKEHNAQRWVTVSAALKLLPFSEQRRVLRHIAVLFIRNKPSGLLNINLKRVL